jgi:fatty-acyl-CoA synthase
MADRDGFAPLIHRWRNDAGRLLLTCDDASLTYAACAARGDELARALLGFGLRCPGRLAVVLPNSVEFVISLYAASRIGAALVPLSTWSRPAEMKRVLLDAAPALILAKDAFEGHGIVAALRSVCACEPALRAIPIFDWTSATSGVRPIDDLLEFAGRCADLVWAAEAALGHHRDADLAILYTSGSTGAPKGVRLRQGAVAQNGAAIAGRMGFDETDRVFSYFPFFFSGGLCNALTGAVSSGAELVTQSRFRASEALSLIRARGCTGRVIWHDGLEPLAAVAGFQLEDVKGMRRGLFIDPSLLQRLGLPPDEGVNMYGMTETATAFTCGDYRESAWIRGSTHGRPFAGNDLRIMSLDLSVPVGIGVEGEICVRGYSLMSGYTDGSEAGSIDEDGYFHTGDVGVVDGAGYLRFIGRRKTMIKIKGLTVQPEEVEATLLRHQAIAKAVVVGQGDGHESSRLVAMVVAKPGARLDASAVESFCRQELSSYKVPSVVEIDGSSFPMSASMKIDRRAAVARLAQLLITEMKVRDGANEATAG